MSTAGRLSLLSLFLDGLAFFDEEPIRWLLVLNLDFWPTQIYKLPPDWSNPRSEKLPQSGPLDPSFPLLNMGIVVRKYLECPVVVVCRQCRTHLADAEGLISRDFQGQHGRAHLYKEV